MLFWGSRGDPGSVVQQQKQQNMMRLQSVLMILLSMCVKSALPKMMSKQLNR